QSLRWAVEIKHEAVERALLGGLELLRGNGRGADLVDLAADRLQSFDRGRGFGAARNVERPGVIEVGRPRRSDVIRIAELGTNLAHQTARESLTENVRGDLQRGVILIA